MAVIQGIKINVTCELISTGVILVINTSLNNFKVNMTSDEEVDYWSFDIDAIPYTDSDHAWSTYT